MFKVNPERKNDALIHKKLRFNHLVPSATKPEFNSDSIAQLSQLNGKKTKTSHIGKGTFFYG